MSRNLRILITIEAGKIGEQLGDIERRGTRSKKDKRELRNTYLRLQGACSTINDGIVFEMRNLEHKLTYIAAPSGESSSPMASSTPS